MITCNCENPKIKTLDGININLVKINGLFGNKIKRHQVQNSINEQQILKPQNCHFSQTPIFNKYEKNIDSAIETFLNEWGYGKQFLKIKEQIKLTDQFAQITLKNASFLSEFVTKKYQEKHENIKYELFNYFHNFFKELTPSLKEENINEFLFKIESVTNDYSKKIKTICETSTHDLQIIKQKNIWIYFVGQPYVADCTKICIPLQICDIENFNSKGKIALAKLNRKILKFYCKIIELFEINASVSMKYSKDLCSELNTLLKNKLKLNIKDFKDIKHVFKQKIHEIKSILESNTQFEVKNQL